MAKDTDNIELRSEKVKKILGQVPPKIIRCGISVICMVILGLLSISYFFKYPYTVKGDVIFNKNGTKIVGVIVVPADEQSKILSGQKVNVYFNRILYMSVDPLVCKVKAKSTLINVTKNGAFVFVYFVPSDSLIMNEGRLQFNGELRAHGIIITENISFWDRLITPLVHTIKNKTE